MTKRIGDFLMLAGLLLLAAALYLAGYNQWEAGMAEKTASAAANDLQEMLVSRSEQTTPEAVPDYLAAPGIEMPTLPVDGRDYIGLLEIPALGLELPILSQWSDAQLKVAPCRYTGSAYLGDLIIAGHNYKSHFGSLGSLRPGDAVIFTDAEGNRFAYAVDTLETVPGSDFEGMEAGDWDLTLFTCTASRADRITVRCVLAE